MEYQDITYEVHDSIATITLNRPERMNSFSEQLLDELVRSDQERRRGRVASASSS